MNKRLFHLELVGPYGVYVANGWHCVRDESGQAPYCLLEKTNQVGCNVKQEGKPNVQYVTLNIEHFRG